jgi:hypothetical protein
VVKKHYVNAVMHAMQRVSYPSQFPVPFRAVTPAGESLIVVKKSEEKIEGKTLSLIIFMMS